MIRHICNLNRHAQPRPVEVACCQRGSVTALSGRRSGGADGATAVTPAAAREEGEHERGSARLPAPLDHRPLETCAGDRGRWPHLESPDRPACSPHSTWRRRKLGAPNSTTESTIA